MNKFIKILINLLINVFKFRFHAEKSRTEPKKAEKKPNRTEINILIFSVRFGSVNFFGSHH